MMTTDTTQYSTGSTSSSSVFRDLFGPLTCEEGGDGDCHPNEDNETGP